MLDTVTIAANPGFPITLANHRFTSNDKGELVHFVETELRATVPPEGWDDYVKYWPSAIDVVRQLRAAHTAKQNAAAVEAQRRMDAALAAIPNADPTVLAAVKAGLSAAFGIAPGSPAAAALAAAAAPNPLDDPAVKAAIAILHAKGIVTSLAG
jgi:hypothetical protein